MGAPEKDPSSGEHARTVVGLRGWHGAADLGEHRTGHAGELGLPREAVDPEPDADHEADGRPRAATKRGGMSHGASTGLGGAAMKR
jgi:hypothetical protein